MAKTTTNKEPKVRKIALPKRHWYAPKTWRRNIALPPRRKLSSARQMMSAALKMIGKRRRTFFGISFVYAIAMFVFVKSFSVGSLTTTSATGIGEKISATLSEFASMASSATGTMSAASGVYQIIVSTICSLALIWYFRQVLSAEKTSVKEAFYLGMRPLVTYLLVLAMFGVQLIPVALGGYLMGLLQGSFVLATGLEQFVAWTIFILLVLWSLYLVVYSIFALFVVTLPNMTPMNALRSAKKMVYRRRLLIWRKIVFATIAVLLACALLLLPFVLWLPGLAPWVFFLLSVFVMSYGQAFLYTLYREIL